MWLVLVNSASIETLEFFYRWRWQQVVSFKNNTVLISGQIFGIFLNMLWNELFSIFNFKPIQMHMMRILEKFNPFFFKNNFCFWDFDFEWFVKNYMELKQCFPIQMFLIGAMRMECSLENPMLVRFPFWCFFPLWIQSSSTWLGQPTIFGPQRVLQLTAAMPLKTFWGNNPCFAWMGKWSQT